MKSIILKRVSLVYIIFLFSSLKIFSQESELYKYKIESSLAIGRVSAMWEDGKFVVRVYPGNKKSQKYQTKLEYIQGGLIQSSVSFLSEVTKESKSVTSKPIGYIFSLPEDLNEFFLILEDDSGRLLLKARVERDMKQRNVSKEIKE